MTPLSTNLGVLASALVSSVLVATCSQMAGSSDVEAATKNRPTYLGLDEATREWIRAQPAAERERWGGSGDSRDALLSILDTVLLKDVPLSTVGPRLRDAARRDPDAAVVLALALLRGDLPPSHGSEAATWLAEASRSGHAQACVELADLYRTGTGVPLDEEYADLLLDFAAERGHSGARRDRLLEALQRPEPLEAHVIDWGEAAASSGDPLGYTVLARAMLESQPVESHVEEALEALEFAAAEGDWAAATILAELDLGENRLTDARSRVEEAAVNGWMPAQLLMARISRAAGSPTEAETWCRAAASGGDPLARLQLAEFLAESAGSIDEAIQIARELAGDGDLDGHYLYGRLALEHGDAALRAEGHGILLIAAGQGHGPASYALSQYYRELDDDSLVVKYLRRAAGDGIAQAQWELGETMRDHHPIEAARWWTEAARAGDERAIRALAQAYRAGFGVPRDDSRADELSSLVATEAAASGRSDPGLEPVSSPVLAEQGSGYTITASQRAPDLDETIRTRRVGSRRSDSGLGLVTDEELGEARREYLDAKQAYDLQTAMWMEMTEYESARAGAKGAQLGWFSVTEHPPPDDWVVERYLRAKDRYELLQRLHR